MSEQQFIDSLSADQAKFYNSRLVAIRSELQAAFATVESNLVNTQRQDIATIQKELEHAQAIIAQMETTIAASQK